MELGIGKECLRMRRSLTADSDREQRVIATLGCLIIVWTMPCPAQHDWVPITLPSTKTSQPPQPPKTVFTHKNTPTTMTKWKSYLLFYKFSSPVKCRLHQVRPFYLPFQSPMTQRHKPKCKFYYHRLCTLPFTATTMTAPCSVCKPSRKYYGT